MGTFHEYLDEYRKQLEKGMIQQVYRGLMEYMMSLRTTFQSKYPDYFVSGSIYQGYMDMTYFSFIPKSLKDRKLRIGIVLLHDTLRFEVWLAGYNKQVQAQYWKLIKDSHWDKYHLVPSIKGEDAILVQVLDDHPDFSNPEALTERIEELALEFIADVEGFLSTHG